MKSLSIIAIAIFALVALCSSAPVAQQPVDETRIDIYNDFLAGLFSNLVSTTFGSISGLLNQLITENPLGVGKRDVQDDIAARIDLLSFLYDNILQDFFSGLVTNTFTTATNALNNLIQTNPLGIGKRDVEGDLATRLDIYNDFLAGLFSNLVSTTFGSISGLLNQLITENPLGVGKRDVQDDIVARIDLLSFLYDNILQDFFSGLVTNTFTTATNALNNLIQTNPLGVGKRDVQDDIVARIDLLSFLYDNILQDFFSGLVTNTFTTATNALNNLIQTNPLGVGKRDVEGDLAARIDLLSFLYDNILQDFFSGLVTNTFTTATNALNNLIQTNPLGVGKRSVNIQQAQALLSQTASTLIETLKTFAHQAAASLNDRQKFSQLIKDNIAFIKTTIATLVQQLSQIIPSALTTELSQGLAMLQSVLVFWTSGLAGSLGPVIGPFRP